MKRGCSLCGSLLLADVAAATALFSCAVLPAEASLHHCGGVFTFSSFVWAQPPKLCLTFCPVLRCAPLKRCVVLHATHNVTVDSNVAFNTSGHCYIIEEGGELNNTFVNNLGIWQRSVSVKIPGTPEESDDRPATFWITNMLNNYINNVAAGSEESGSVPDPPPPFPPAIHSPRNYPGNLHQGCTSDASTSHFPLTAHCHAAGHPALAWQLLHARAPTGRDPPRNLLWPLPLLLCAVTGASPGGAGFGLS